MTLGLTPTLGLIGAIILILLHVAISLLLLSFLFCLSHPVWLADRLRSQWLTASVDINCAFARCFGTGERLLGDMVADVTEDSCNETSIPWQQLSRPCTLTPSACLFFILRLSFLPMTSFLHLSVSFTMMICICPSVPLPHSVGVLWKDA